MARETKVGLLAGLAFIVCFATILTKRGRDGGYRRVFPELVAGDPNGGSHGAVSEFASHQSVSDQDRNLGRNQNRIRAGTFAKSSHGSESPAPASGRAQPEDSFSDGSLKHPQVALTPTEPETGDRKGNARPGDGDNSVDRDMRSNPAWRVKLERRLEELAAAVHHNNAATPTGPPQPQPVTLSAARDHEPGRTPKVALAEYHVQKGDTLTSIAARFYGTRSRRIINAIFDANRARLPDVSQLRAGIELALPVVDGFDPPRILTTDKQQRKSKQKSRSVRTPARKNPSRKTPAQETPSRKGSSRENQARTVWYNVQKNDRYSSIAREELGDAGRWREIFELNKDRFPDPHKIRPGVRIKLPPTVLAVSGSAKR